MSILVLNIILGGLAGTLAQQAPIAGGYADASTNDGEVVAAARYAIRAQGRRQGARISLVSIERAEVQVVAGLNYRLHLRVNINGRMQSALAVVYQNLRRKYSLSNWEIEARGTGSSNRPDDSSSTIEQLVKVLADAYTARALGKLDAEHPPFGKVRIVIENSLAEDRARDRFVVKEFKTFERAEQWLRSLERDDSSPSRETKPPVGCRKGICTYDFSSGILHNQLYIKKISYGLRGRRPYIRTIYLLDGD